MTKDDYYIYTANVLMLPEVQTGDLHTREQSDECIDDMLQFAFFLCGLA